jgi:YD repeat-containing protein
MHFLFARCLINARSTGAQCVGDGDGQSAGLDCLSHGRDQILISGGRRIVRHKKIVLEPDTRITAKRCPGGHAGRLLLTFAHDAHGNTIESAYFGVDGQPMLSKDLGAARVTYAHDARGNIVESAFFGVDGQPTLSDDWSVAPVTYAYDARGNTIESAHFGVDGQPLRRVVMVGLYLGLIRDRLVLCY